MSNVRCIGSVDILEKRVISVSWNSSVGEGF